MTRETSPKVTAQHLGRNAYLYIRQSTARQVLENTESAQRQYGLRQRAAALGWPEQHIVVIDSDQGQSGATAADREGFQFLVAEVGMGRAGIVLGLEVSRLARNNADWHRLLEICALTGTLILDEDGIYDPGDFNDRLLLGLKGTMSEAELHLIQARLRGGMLSKARRGEFVSKLPVGFVYDEQRRVRLDPDVQVQAAIRLLFETYRRLGTVYAAVRYFHEHQILFPRGAAQWGQGLPVQWIKLCLGTALGILHNPRYAGAYCFGRNCQRHRPGGGKMQRSRPREEWIALIPGAHEGYITWEEFEANQVRLRNHCGRPGRNGGATPAREGLALLQGLVLCGRCGKPMRTVYYVCRDRRQAAYACHGQPLAREHIVCQSTMGAALDAAVGALVVEAVTPLSLEVALAVQEELSVRADETERLRRHQVERCQYEAELARRRFMAVAPENRLVAQTLEAQWNEKLAALEQAREACERGARQDRLILGAAERDQVLALAGDFPRLWNDPATPMRERKRMLRLLIEDVTILKQERQIELHVRFKGGASRTLTVPAAVPVWEVHATPPRVLEEIDRLLEDHPEDEVAVLLEQQGLASSSGKPFSASMVKNLRDCHGLKSHYQRLRERGLLTVGEMAWRLGVIVGTVKKWRQAGRLRAYRFSCRPGYLYEPPGVDAPVKRGGKKKLDHGPGNPESCDCAQ